MKNFRSAISSVPTANGSSGGLDVRTLGSRKTVWLSSANMTAGTYQIQIAGTDAEPAGGSAEWRDVTGATIPFGGGYKTIDELCTWIRVTLSGGTSGASPTASATVHGTYSTEGD